MRIWLVSAGDSNWYFTRQNMASELYKHLTDIESKVYPGETHDVLLTEISVNTEINLIEDVKEAEDNEQTLEEFKEAYFR